MTVARPRMRIGSVVWTAWMAACLAVVLGFFLTLYTAAAVYLGPREMAIQARGRELLHNIQLSVVSASFTMLLCLAIGIPTAYWLRLRLNRLQPLVRRIIDLPLLIPPGAVGIFLIGFFVSPPGVLIRDITGLQFIHARSGLVVGQFAVTVAFCVRLLVAVFEDIDLRLEQVARSLGATRGRAFVRVVFPLAAPGIIGAALLTWIRAVGEFDALMMYLMPSPLESKCFQRASTPLTWVVVLGSTYAF